MDLEQGTKTKESKPGDPRMACYHGRLREGACITPVLESFGFTSLNAALNEARSRELIHRRGHE